MKKASLLLMIILLVSSQLTFGYASVNAMSTSNSIPNGDLSLNNGDEGVVQPNDTDNHLLKSNTEDDSKPSIPTKDENTSLDDEVMTRTPYRSDDFYIIDRGNGVAIVDYKGDKKDVVIPDEINGEPVIEIAELAFLFKQITRVTIPTSVTTIGGWAFAYNQLTSVEIPTNVTTIGRCAFAHNQLERVEIPSSVTMIGIDAFAINQLESVVIPSSVTTIESGAFYSNQLTKVEIPSSVTTIGHVAFSSNPLDIVTFNGELEFQPQRWSNGDGAPFDLPHKDEKTFLGWFEDRDYSVNWDNSSVTKPMTIYAKWK